jgi:hypothetical protein
MERRTFVSFTLQDYAGLKSFIFFIENFTHEDKVWYSEDIMDQLYSHQPINKFNRLNYIGYKK